jgi:hypothetical protein
VFKKALVIFSFQHMQALRQRLEFFQFFPKSREFRKKMEDLKKEENVNFSSKSRETHLTHKISFENVFVARFSFRQKTVFIKVFV